MKRYLLLLPLIALPGAAQVDPALLPPEREPALNVGPPAPPKPKPMSASQAVALALQDVQTVNPYDRPFIRYIWCPDGQFKTANVALNVLSRGVSVVRAFPLARGKLLRVDARLYALFDPNSKDGRNKDIDDFLRTWEELRYDPAFALLVTQDNIKFSGQKVPTKIVEETVETTERVLEDCEPYIQNGVRFTQWYVRKKVKKTIKREVAQEFDVLRYNPDYLDPALKQLQDILYTEAPIVQDSYFMARGLHTVKNDKGNRAFAVVWGGLYYEFRGIKRSKQAGVTDEDLFLQLFGIRNAAKLFDQLQSDQRAALFKSDVTGKPRRVDFFHTPSGKGWDMIGLGSITHDLLDRDIDIGTHPVMNLLAFKDNAREEIMVSPNGMHAYAIFDGQGKLLDEADINAVTDRTVPSPHSPKLQCAMSCMACHEAEGSDGWKDVRNDVKTMLGSRLDPLTGRNMLRVDVVADAGFKDQIGVINRIAGLYAGSFAKGIRRGRDDYAQTILKASGPQGDDQLQIVKTGVGAVVEQTRTYLYGQGGNGVDARQALWELGMEPGDEPARTLAAALPPEPADVGFLPEDARLAALKDGLAIPRADWSFVRSFAASRVHRNKGGHQ